MRRFTSTLRHLLYTAVFGLVVGGVLATDQVETKTGFLIPSQCQPATGEGVKPEPKGSSDAWPAPHTTACALEPACIESGYGLWVVDRFYRFDEDGQKKALHYFKTTPRTSYNKLRVTGDFRDPNAVRVEGLELTD